MIAMHYQNADLANQVVTLALSKNLGVTTYSSSLRTGNFDGYVRYAVYKIDRSGRPFGTRSKRVLLYASARFQKNFRPSIVGEASALRRLLFELEAI